MGAKSGANVARRQATRDGIQPASLQVNGPPGHARRLLAMAGMCMACKRSGVRIPIAPPRGLHVSPVSMFTFGSDILSCRACGGCRA